MLLGRDHERLQIEQALALSRSGASAVLALTGEPGIGKTALLEFAVGRADGMQLLRARGIESEAQIPFGSLLELIRPALVLLDKIPEPQAVALEGALALRPGSAQDRFALGAATLSLLAAYAEQAPVAVIVDDAQWLDGSSAQALLFAFRRLVADPIAVLIAVREGEPSLLDGAGLPTLRIGGLTSDEAASLMPEMPPETARRLHRATAGNPLALLELASSAPDLELAPERAPVPVPASISRAFLSRAGRLTDTARQALVLAAASDTGDLATLERAAARLETDLSGLAAAENAGLVRLGPGTVEFRHPLARSAVYADAPASQRRAAHRALAAALPDRDVDRRAWHLAAAAVGTDESASAALAQAAARSRDRSAYATAAAAFERAGRLAPDGEVRARLLWQAAETGWLAGLTGRAVALLDEARALAGNPRTLVEIDRLAGHIATLRGPVMHGYAILTAAAGRRRAGTGRGDAGRSGQRMPLRGEPGADAAGRRAGLGRPVRRARRPAPASWPRWHWGWPGSSAVTRQPAPKRCTRRSRSPRTRPRCATTSACCPGWRSRPCSSGRPPPAVPCSSTRCRRPVRTPRSACSRSRST